VTDYRQVLGGIAAMVASQLAFLFNDALVKLASVALPMGEILFIRGLFCASFVGGAVIALGLHRSIAQLWHRMPAFRSIGELGATYFYLAALFHMPIANVTIIFQAAPLAVAAGAALVLGEHVGWRRWAAIVVGFLGVLMVVRPGLSGFDVHGLLVLVSVLFVTMRDLTTRAMPAAIPTLVVSLATALTVTAMGAALGLTEDWVRPSPVRLLQLASAAGFLAVGYVSIIFAMRSGALSVTASFRYVAVVFAIALGYVIWGDLPDAMTIAGSVVIVGSGLYTLYRERQAGRRAAIERSAA
jgi:drug/metabolite transporter (DMT)-like permease